MRNSRIGEARTVDFGAKGPPRPEINLTQLIDVVLLLLIFFMISTSFVAQPGISIRLPKSRTTERAHRAQTRVTLTSAGLLFVDEAKVNWESLLAVLKQHRGGNLQALLVINADESVKHGLVVRVMDVAKQAGFERIAIATRPYPVPEQEAR